MPKALPCPPALNKSDKIAMVAGPAIIVTLAKISAVTNSGRFSAIMRHKHIRTAET